MSHTDLRAILGDEIWKYTDIPSKLEALIAQQVTAAIEQIKQLQTYKLSADSPDKLVELDDVITTLQATLIKDKEEKE